MKVSDLVKLLSLLDQDLVVVIPEDFEYHFLTENEVSEVFLFADLSSEDSAGSNDVEPYISIGVNQFS